MSKSILKLGIYSFLVESEVMGTQGGKRTASYTLDQDNMYFFQIFGPTAPIQPFLGQQTAKNGQNRKIYFEPCS